MSTMTLPLPTPARGAPDPSGPAPSARADKPAKSRDNAPTRDAKGTDKPEDSRFGHALEQARDDEPQAAQAQATEQAAPVAATEAPNTAPVSQAIDPTLASLWIGSALPEAATAPAQAADLVQEQPNTGHATSTDDTDIATDGQPSAHPIALPLGLAMTAIATPRTAQMPTVPTAPTAETADAPSTGQDTRAMAAPVGGPSTDNALAAIAKASAATPGNTVAPITEQRPAASTATLQAQPSWATIVADTTAAQPAASGATLTLPATPPTQWREPLLNALGERVQWQLQRGQEQAVIRLEPPNLGRLEIHIRQEAGGLQVHLNATHRDVVQQLQGVSDQLRSELSLRHAGDVAVAVADQGRDADARQRGRGQDGEQRQDPGRALSEGDTNPQQRSAFTLVGGTVEKA